MFSFNRWMQCVGLAVPQGLRGVWAPASCDPAVVSVMRPMRRSLRFGWAMVSVVPLGLAVLLPRGPGLAHEPSCAGTLLQLSVLEQAGMPVARFRFSLALSGAGSTEQAALTQLNQRLGRLRQSLQPFIQGRLIVPSPITSPRSGHQGAAPSFMANTGVSGEVNRQMYSKFIQAVAGLPGVRMQGMESMANEPAVTVLQQRLMAAALRRGQAEADSTAAALGATRVRLLRINRSDAMRGPRRVQLSTAMRSGFDPGEAPKPATTLRLELDYCLT